MKKAFLLLLVIVQLACHKQSDLCHEIIVVHNASEHEVLIKEGTGNSDTVYGKILAPHLILSSDLAAPRSEKGVVLTASPHGLCWEARIRSKDYSDKDTLTVWVLDPQEMKKSYDLGETWNDKVLLQRYDLSLSDLRMLDFQVHFPATQAMGHIKMYPPFKP